MSRKAGPSLDDLSAVIAELHDAGAGGAEWPAALSRLDGLFDSYTAVIWTQDRSGRFLNVREHTRRTESAADYMKYYERLDLLRHSVMRGPVDTVLTNEMVISRSEFVRTEFCADFAERYDMYDCMQARLFDGAEHSGYLLVTRHKRFGAFEHENVRLLRLLMPHLRRAMETELRLATLGVQRDCALEALGRLRHGVLIVDADARVTFVNDAADAILRTGDGLGTEPANRRLRASAPGQTATLHRLVAQATGRDKGSPRDAGGNGALRLDRATGVPLLLTIAPLGAETAWNGSTRPAAIILIAMPEDAVATAPGHLRTLFSLTPTESAVAVRIAQGQGVAAAAESLRVSPSTLRWHLQRVFEKTGTTRQAELARLVERVGTVTGNGAGA